jgi:hypothetical protein
VHGEAVRLVVRVPALSVKEARSLTIEEEEP